MTKAKYLIMSLLVGIILFMIPTMVKATDTFTTDDGIVAKKVVSSTGGSIELKFSNIALNDEVNYTWAIGRTSNVEDIEKWYALGDFSSINKTATVTLTPEDIKIRKILRETNTAWIYIKDNTNDTFIVEALKVDLTLPVLKAFKITENPDSSTFRSYRINTVYGIGNLYYKIEKITDEQIIAKYTEAKLKGTSLESISGLATVSDAPQDGWNLVDENYAAINDFYISNKPTEPGIYYVWIKGKDTDSKMVFGYNIFGLDNIAPTVSNIKVVSPTSGTYLTGQTVTIRVNFNEIITGTSTPTLIIKFGDSAERSLTNGTIKDNYVEYTYNIQESDKGQLATVSLSGGTLKDAYNNAASLTCPFISGNTIKANVDGTTNNNTPNQDTTNNDNKPNDDSNTPADDSNTPADDSNKPTDSNKPADTTTKPDTSKKEDNTTATGKLPQTGLTMGMTLAIIAVLAGGVFAYFKYSKLRGI